MNRSRFLKNFSICLIALGILVSVGCTQGRGESCYGGKACKIGLNCIKGTCQAICGELGQACCNGVACNAGMGCIKNTCQMTTCGGLGQACCNATDCNSPNLTCIERDCVLGTCFRIQINQKFSCNDHCKTFGMSCNDKDYFILGFDTSDCNGIPIGEINSCNTYTYNNSSVLCPCQF